MFLTARKTGANCHSSLLLTCTESPVLCHTSKSNNRSVIAISFRRRYHNNRPDISLSVNFTLARSANSGRLFCVAFSNTDTVEPILPIFTPPVACCGSAPASLGQPGLPRRSAVPCLLRLCLKLHRPQNIVNQVTAGWWPVTSGIPQGSILGLVFFNNFINDLDSRDECALFAKDTKLGEAVYSLEGRTGLKETP